MKTNGFDRVRSTLGQSFSEGASGGSLIGYETFS
jgi:hypothetical protein